MLSALPCVRAPLPAQCSQQLWEHLQHHHSVATYLLQRVFGAGHEAKRMVLSECVWTAQWCTPSFCNAPTLANKQAQVMDSIMLTSHNWLFDVVQACEFTQAYALSLCCAH